MIEDKPSRTLSCRPSHRGDRITPAGAQQCRCPGKIEDRRRGRLVRPAETDPRQTHQVILMRIKYVSAQICHSRNKSGARRQAELSRAATRPDSIGICEMRDGNAELL